jgi:SAM-dependent methyltransferase
MRPDTTSGATARPDADAIRTFYDGFTRKLIADYVQGNIRQFRAFELVRSAIGPGTRTILDVGCGIGASSASYIEGRPDVTVHGVDISPNNVEVATRLFPSRRLHFSVSDMQAPPSDRRYDLIALVDMHEHIPREHWPGFHRVLAESLSENGTIVMTTPSPLHQDHLTTRKPEGLQVVDETLELSDVTALADRVGGTVIRYDWIGIWHTNDYVHTIISRAPRFDPIPRRARWMTGARVPVIVGRGEDLARRVMARVQRGRRSLHVRKTLGIGILTVLFAGAEAVRIAVDPGHRLVPGWGQLADRA